LKRHPEQEKIFTRLNKQDFFAPNRWRTRLQPIRTVTEGNTEPAECASEITASIKILPVVQVPLYQKIAQKATKLHLLGMGYKDIAKSLNVSKTTVINAISWQNTQR
jgi:hypothetical protein